MRRVDYPLQVLSQGLRVRVRARACRCLPLVKRVDYLLQVLSQALRVVHGLGRGSLGDILGRREGHMSGELVLTGIIQVTRCQLVGQVFPLSISLVKGSPLWKAL